MTTTGAAAVAPLEVVLLGKHQIGAVHVVVSRFERQRLGLWRIVFACGFEFEIATHGSE